MQVVIKSNGQRVGAITPDQFRESTHCPKSAFLPECVERFNSWKESLGEPERAEIEL